MFVRIVMKNGDLYEGVKCGSEGGLVYIVGAYKLIADEEDTESYMTTQVGGRISCYEDDVRVLQLPTNDIEFIISLSNE